MHGLAPRGEGFAPRGPAALPAGLLPRPDLVLIEACIARIEGGEPAGAQLDAAVMAARGFEVMGRFSSAARGSCRHPVRGGAPWQRVPRLSADPLAAGAVVPWGWHWGMAMRGAPSAWCQDAADPMRFCEGHARSLALAVLKVALHATRLLLREAAARPLMAPSIDTASCACGWAGPADAWRHGGCPDCGRRVSHGAPLLIAEGVR